MRKWTICLVGLLVACASPEPASRTQLEWEQRDMTVEAANATRYILHVDDLTFPLRAECRMNDGTVGCYASMPVVPPGLHRFSVESVNAQGAATSAAITMNVPPVTEPVRRY